jgi:hypothetical protein
MIPTLFCQVADQGVDIIIKFTDAAGAIFPLNGSDTLQVRMRYPDGTVHAFVAHLFTDGTDGKAVYTTGIGDIPQEGLYQVQGTLTRTGFTKNTRLGLFQALANVEG